MTACHDRKSHRHPVFVRWRPLDQGSEADTEISRSYDTTQNRRGLLTINPRSTPRGGAEWSSGTAFDEIFETNASNDDVFDASVAPALQHVLMGNTSNFFAYGHTGSGKTYTIVCQEPASNDIDRGSDGLLLMSAQRLFQGLDFNRSQDVSSETKAGQLCGVGLRMFELRGNKAYDLLDGRKECFIRQGEDGKTHIRGETEVLEGGRVRVRPIQQRACWTLPELKRELQHGLHLRSTGTSTVHDRSSRTHAMFELEIISENLVKARDGLVEAESELVPVGKAATDVYIDEMSQSLVRNDDGSFAENPERPTDHARFAKAEAQKKVHEDRVAKAQEKVFDLLRETSPIPLGGKVVFADLAGAEFYSATPSSGDRLKQTAQERQEGRQINADLLALKEVIRAWASKKTHVPFRSSTLTMVLREHFTASKTNLSSTLLTLSPANTHLQATMNTLKYGKVIGSSS
ncbi:hypothetical protein KC318_g7437 [Hortaea werneckii]|nr:hypothetical protein KC334_g2819 [Hortaea werneckii]KAI7022550.1 hypothetical protein KC355_g2029 [Hortaea werneckii]KAI7664908.1 hypothetical protein KC318_g7437 [Hortaea werneckii]